MADEHEEFDGRDWQDMPVPAVDLYEELKRLGIAWESAITDFEAGPAHFHELAMVCAICRETIGIVGVVSTPHGTFVTMALMDLTRLMGQQMAHVITAHTKGMRDDDPNPVAQIAKATLDAINRINQTDNPDGRYN